VRTLSPPPPLHLHIPLGQGTSERARPAHGARKGLPRATWCTPVKKAHSLSLGTVCLACAGGRQLEANELVPRFRQRGWEIKSYLKTVVLPIGRLPVGLCRHRALTLQGTPCYYCIHDSTVYRTVLYVGLM